MGRHLGTEGGHLRLICPAATRSSLPTSHLYSAPGSSHSCFQPLQLLETQLAPCHFKIACPCLQIGHSNHRSKSQTSSALQAVTKTDKGQKSTEISITYVYVYCITVYCIIHLRSSILRIITKKKCADGCCPLCI